MKCLCLSDLEEIAETQNKKTSYADTKTNYFQCVKCDNLYQQSHVSFNGRSPVKTPVYHYHGSLTSAEIIKESPQTEGIIPYSAEKEIIQQRNKKGCCENRNLEDFTKTIDPKKYTKIGLQIGQTTYAQCTNCETVYQKLVCFGKIYAFVPYDGKLTAEELKEVAPRCSEKIPHFIEMDYLTKRRRI